MQFRFPDGLSPDGASFAINCRDAQDVLGAVRTALQEGRGFALATLNVDHLQRLGQDPGFARAYAAHDLICADGNPVVWLSRLAGRPVELVPGSDLVVPLMRVAADGDWPVALIGSSGDSLTRAGLRLQELAPGLRIVLHHAPGFPFDPSGDEAAQLIETIRSSGARLCLLALGAPRQERFAIHARDALSGVGFASIGAGIDFLSGHQRRAPLAVRRARMEWLWRMLSNPRRLAGRYARGFTILPGHALDAVRQGKAARNRSD